VASLDEMALAQQVRRIGGLEGASGGRPEVA
ncbi:MAG: ArsR family transcriptional regulator, partial [Stutzerimonas stutzeri]